MDTCPNCGNACFRLTLPTEYEWDQQTCSLEIPTYGLRPKPTDIKFDTALKCSDCGWGGLYRETLYRELGEE